MPRIVRECANCGTVIETTERLNQKVCSVDCAREIKRFGGRTLRPILEFLDENGLVTPEELAENFGKTTPQVRKILSDHTRSGRKLVETTFGLTAEGKDFLKKLRAES